MEVYKILPEGTLAELINGIIYMSPAPSLSHQEITTTLVGLFYLYLKECRSGKVFVSPVDVFFDEVANAVQPDVVFVLEENKGILKEDAIHGTPDLIVEVLSPGTIEHDFKRKKDLYERCGVQEYWIVNPKDQEAIGYTLVNGRYVEFSRATGCMHSKLLDHTFRFVDENGDK